MNKTLNSLTRTLAPLVTALKSPGRKRNTRRLKRRNRSSRTRTVNNPAWGRSLPAAYASHVRPRFNVVARTATSCTVSGCDLVYAIPRIVVNDSGDALFAVITANPAYWSGTRIAQFAPAYMNYRPIRMTFSYIPQVAVTQQGTVYMGTLWNGAAPVTDIQQTLFTSNGGCLTQCYVPCDTTIKLGTNLQYNLFQLNEDINPKSNPFLFLAGIAGADVVPGYFYVTYTYEFKNPIGQAWFYEYLSTQSVSNVTTQPNYNTSIVLLQQDAELGPGTVLQVENRTSGGDSIIGTYYNGSLHPLSADTKVMVYRNFQSRTVAELQVNDSTITPVNPSAPTQAVSVAFSRQGQVGSPQSLIESSGNYFELPSGSRTWIMIFSQASRIYAYVGYSTTTANYKVHAPNDSQVLYAYSGNGYTWNDDVALIYSHDGQSITEHFTPVTTAITGDDFAVRTLFAVDLGAASLVGASGSTANFVTVTAFKAGSVTKQLSEFIFLPKNEHVEIPEGSSIVCMRRGGNGTATVIRYARVEANIDFSSNNYDWYYAIFEGGSRNVYVLSGTTTVMEILNEDPVSSYEELGKVNGMTLTPSTGLRIPLFQI